MGKIVTQTRLTDDARVVVYSKKYITQPVTKTVVAVDGATNPRQTTTSYRSGGEYSGTSVYDLYESSLRLRNGIPSEFDRGHEFFTERRVLRFSHPNYYVQSVNGDVSYQGALYPAVTTSTLRRYPTVTPLTSNEVAVVGNRLLKSAIPTLPSAGVAVALAEMRQGLPSLPQIYELRNNLRLLQHNARASQGAWNPKKPDREYLSGQGSKAKPGTVVKGAGNAFVGYEFGVLPVVGDITKLLKQMLKVDKTMISYLRDSGSVTRRHRHEVTEDSQGPIVSVSNTASLDNFLTPTNYDYHRLFPVGSTGTGQLTYTDYKRVEYKFSGAFSYFVPLGDSFTESAVRIEQLLSKIAGTRLFSPDSLWELVPWSWLIDWVTNIGDVLSIANALNSDGLVMRYGYLQRTTLAERTFVLQGVRFRGPDPGAIRYTFTTLVKERKRATPYGFGLDPQLFTPRQWAILASLGMTDSSKRLRYIG
jgi:hypothetical protein